MNLHHLAVFHAVARGGSVSLAARRLHISQPAVSRELKDLEGRLGVSLFERRPRGMHLTEAGALLAGYAERIFALESSAESALHDFLGLQSGSLELGASHTLGTYLLPRWLAAFGKRYPRIRVSLEILNTEGVARGVRDYRYACGFVEGLLPEDDFEIIELCRDEIVPVVAADQPLASAPPATAQALAEVPALLRERGSGTRVVLEESFRRQGLSLRCAGEINSAEALLRAVMAGAGLTWLSRVGLADPLATGRIVELPAHGLHVERCLRLIRARERYLSPAVAAFIALCTSGVAGSASTAGKTPASPARAASDASRFVDAAVPAP